MSLLEVNNLTMSYPDKMLYKNSNFNLETGEHLGIIGPNGSGKSTLIKILTGQELPVSGQIKWQKNIKVGYLDQYANIPKGITLNTFLHTAYSALYKKENITSKLYNKYSQTLNEKYLKRATRMQNELEASNFYSIDNKIKKMITGLGLNSIGENHIISEMSGGQRTKIILAKLLLQKNNVIILDEPTNYLDTPHIKWLENYLNNFEGATIIVSHDFKFLNVIANSVLDIDFQKLTKYRGNFNSALKQKKEHSKQHIKAYNKQQKIIKKTKNFIQKNKARASTTKRAQSREKMLLKMKKVEPPEKNPQSHYTFPYIASRSAEALRTKILEVGYNPKKPILNPINMRISAGEKVAFTGFNGAGKTTLIKTLLGILPPISGKYSFSPSTKINYLSQDLIWNNNRKTPLQIIQTAHPLEGQKKIRTRLASAGINADNATKQLRFLSGGEQEKVKLALMELIKSNFLILDEPTNHLDESTKSSLKKSIKNFKGSLILVTHERNFYIDWIDKEINIASISHMHPSEKKIN